MPQADKMGKGVARVRQGGFGGSIDKFCLDEKMSRSEGTANNVSRGGAVAHVEKANVQQRAPLAAPSRCPEGLIFHGLSANADRDAVCRVRY